MGTVWELFPLSSMDPSNAVCLNTPLPTPVLRSTKTSSPPSQLLTDHGPLPRPSTTGRTMVAKVLPVNGSPETETTQSCLSSQNLPLTANLPTLDAGSLHRPPTTLSGRRMPSELVPLRPL